MWYENAHWRDRLAVEVALMRERFPGFALMQTRDGALVWRGFLEPIEGAVFEISVTMPARYPYATPTLRVEAPALLPGAPHRYIDGSICVHHEAWDPMRGTVASMIPLAAAWLVGYLAWLETGEGF